MEYIVRPGDYLGKIATDMNSKYKDKTITVAQIIEWNKDRYPEIVTNPDLIYEGWKLYLGVDGEPNTNKDRNESGTHSHADLKLTGTVIVEGSLYDDCTGSKKNIGKLNKGDRITTTKKCANNKDKVMYYLEGPDGVKGWFPKTAIEFDNSVDKETAETPKYGLESSTEDSYLESLYSNMYGIGASTNISYRDLLVHDSVGIHGMPYQFMDDVDNRLSDEIKFGRTYIDRIITKMPLLLLTPGRANFMPAYNKIDKDKVRAALIEKGSSNTSVIADNLERLLTGSENHRYYTFEFQFKEYYYYVNKMLRYCAVCLGIDKVKYPCHGNDGMRNNELGGFTWDYLVNDKLKGFLSQREFVAFYADAVTSISEDISTSTTHSQLGDTFNGLSSLAKEVQFLAGPIAGAEFIANNIGDEKAFNDEISEIWSSMDKTFNSTLFERLTSGFKTVASGGKLLFPEIWDDSEFSKSYSIDFKFRTPDGDKLSWYYNICVPLIHLLALAAPREMGVNGYMSPFLCRAYYKGLFNVDMGIITNMSISKGKEGAWTVDGLPTEVDVSITIKELYQTLAISGGSVYEQLKEPFKFFRNTALIDYLTTTCGINVNKPELDRVLDTYLLFMKNIFGDAVHYGTQWLGLEQAAVNFVADMYSIITFKR